MGLSLGEIGWIVCLAGLPWAIFLDRTLDLWHAQAAWMQLWILLLFGWALQRGVRSVPNKPLAAWIVWMGLWTWQLFLQGITHAHQYPLPSLMPWMHQLCFVLMVVSLQSVMTETGWTWMLRAIAWSGLVVVVYGVLQLLNLDQFFNPLNPLSVNTAQDVLVGTIGNPAHLAAQLALWMPIWLSLGGWWLGAAGVACGLLVASKSAAGCLAAAVAGLWYAWHRSRRSFWIASGVLGIAGVLGCWRCPDLLNPHGRWAAWQVFWGHFLNAPITGQHPGFVIELSQTITDVTNPIRQWRQCHNEWLQVLVETGVIGLGIVLWAVVDLIRRVWTAKKTPTMVCWIGMLLAFGLNSCLNYPAHLWAVNAYALVAYAGVLCLTAPDQEWECLL